MPPDPTALADTRLAESVPMMVASVILVAAVLGFVFWLQRQLMTWMDARDREERADRQLSRAEIGSTMQHLLDRHEAKEDTQFRTVADNTATVSDLTDRIAENTAAVRRLAEAHDHPQRTASMTATEPIPSLTAVPPGEFRVPPGEQISDVVGPDVFRALADDLTDWWHEPFKLDALHARGATGKGQLVAILDTGIDVAHPDLASGCQGQPHQDFTGSPYGYKDRHGHGTHCAGLAAARSANGGAVGGGCEANIIALKVLGDGGSGRSDWTSAGIRRAADVGATVISMSLGGPDDRGPTQAALRYAIAKGCWIVAAAGNEGPNTIGFPGGYPESVCVAAVGPDLRRASFSSTNREVDVAGAGVSVYSTLPGNRYGRMSGTSMATPVCAGLLAAVRSGLVAAGAKVPDQNGLIAAIKATARDLPPTGPDTGTGAGLLDAVALLDHLLAAGKPNPEPPPVDPPAPNPPDGGWLELVVPPGARKVLVKFAAAVLVAVALLGGAAVAGVATVATVPVPGYADLRAWVAAGGTGTLAVGVEAPADVRVPAGYLGIAPGVYECRPSSSGPTMARRADVVPAAAVQVVQPVTVQPVTVQPAGGCYTDPRTGKTVCPLKR